VQVTGAVTAPAILIFDSVRFRMVFRFLSAFYHSTAKRRKRGWLHPPLALWFSIAFLLTACAGVGRRSAIPEPAAFGPAVRAGTLENALLKECSGLAASEKREDLLWAVNDGGNGPYLYALDTNGRDLGRVRVEGVDNRDWEGLDSFVLDGRAFLLIADFGDNRRRHDTHTLIVVQEPEPPGGGHLAEAEPLQVSWRIRYTYPGRFHDAEAVAVDERMETVLVLTKRDATPVLYEIPLRPKAGDFQVVARQLVLVEGIPPPSLDDLLYPYGAYRSQPTAMDIDPRGRHAVVLTYKDAYLFSRHFNEGWVSAFQRSPEVIPLPRPEHHPDLRQREAVCFDRKGWSLFVTSEGENAALFTIQAKRGGGEE
jgi:hypothetical protein